MKPIGFIFARGGSKGIPHKNLQTVGGKSLIARAVEQALASKFLNRVIVSTDDTAIAAAARDAGAQVPFIRPADLAADTSPEWLAWRHAVTESGGPDAFDAFVSIPATAPLRQPRDIDACIERFISDDVDAVITVTPAARNPYFNMVKPRPNGTVGLVMEPSGSISRRQDAPAMYDMTTVCYVLRPTFIMEKERLFDGRVAAVEVPTERALDIDTELDLKIARALADS